MAELLNVVRDVGGEKVRRQVVLDGHAGSHVEFVHVDEGVDEEELQ